MGQIYGILRVHLDNSEDLEAVRAEWLTNVEAMKSRDGIYENSLTITRGSEIYTLSLTKQ